MYRDYEIYEDQYDFYRMERFADPYGESSLHPGPRVHECPTCGEPNRLSDRDVQAGYQCDPCAEAIEFG